MLTLSVAFNATDVSACRSSKSTEETLPPGELHGDASDAVELDKVEDVEEWLQVRELNSGSMRT
jgi:hypothetical protein